METQNLVISFDYSWFLAKNLAYAECLIMKFHYRNSSSLEYLVCITLQKLLNSFIGLNLNKAVWFWHFKSCLVWRVNLFLLIWNCRQTQQPSAHYCARLVEFERQEVTLGSYTVQEFWDLTFTNIQGHDTLKCDDAFGTKLFVHVACIPSISAYMSKLLILS